MNQPRLCVIAVLLLLLAGAASALEITSHTIDGGGGVSSSAGYVLKGTVGQPDAGAHISARFSLNGGFWPPPEATAQGDAVFANGFE